jgi:N,N'-diacetyllegionaminate synthase
MTVKIIAEAGINHNGSISQAIKLIKKASEANADFIKFQIFKSENVATLKAKKSSYQKINSKDNETQLKMIKKFELKFDDFKKLKKECKKNKINFLCSPFDIESAKFLKKLDEKIIKIPSGEITNFPLLVEIGKMKKKIILSTGMSNISEIKKALKILIENGTKRDDISILHCITAYPTPLKEVNLGAINNLKKKFNINVGFSDHTKGIEIPIAAVAIGAQIIEKHITLDKNLKGPDHKSSLNPEEFKRMVSYIRNTELTIKNYSKKTQFSEQENKKIVRKSIVAKKFIKKGEFFSKDNLTVKRPGYGKSPMKWLKIIGKKAKKNYEQDEFI